MSKINKMSPKVNKLGRTPSASLPITPRVAPDGNSVKKKAKLKLQMSTPVLGSHSKKLLRTSLQKLKTVKHGGSFNQTPGKRRNSNSKMNKSITDLKSPESAYVDMVGDSGLAKSAKKNKENSFDKSWEAAVTKARGVPDGAHEEDEYMEVKKSTPKNKNKSGKFEKSNSNSTSFKRLKTAAKSFKDLNCKKDITKKSVKRKNSGKEEDGNSINKKPKLEEMTAKERKIQRRMSKQNYNLSIKAKKLWESIRIHKLEKDKRQEYCETLFNLVSGKAKDLIFAHDTVRVFECLIKYGTIEQRNSLFEELKEKVGELTKSKYGKFFVKKLLKYGNKQQKAYVIQTFYGKVRKLVRHQDAADVLEYAYNNYATAQHRAALMEEFYGPSFALFKTPDIRTLEQIMKSHPEKRDSILSNMKETAAVLAEKTAIKHSIVHRVFYEYFTYATLPLRTEMVETLRDIVVHMLHTREGSRVAMYCLWYGTPKDRKIIIKSMKTYVEKICKEEYGHLVMLSMFDVVDDTKLMEKAILQELLKSIKELAFDQYGRKVLLYLLSPRDPLHFHPDIVNVLKLGDDNPHSKKDTAVRRMELLRIVSPSLLQFVVDNAKEIILDNATLLLLLAIISHSTVDPSKAMAAVAEIAAEPFVAGDLSSHHIVEHPAGHLTLKRLILNDVESMKENKNDLFAVKLMEAMDGCSLKSWAACNRGCFILITLLELNHPVITEWVKTSLAGIRQSLSKMNFKGAQILLSKLSDS